MQYLLDNECEILLCVTNAVLGSAMTRSLGFLVGRREEGAEKLDEGTLAWAEMEVEGVNDFLSRKAQDQVDRAHSGLVHLTNKIEGAYRS